MSCLGELIKHLFTVDDDGLEIDEDAAVEFIFNVVFEDTYAFVENSGGDVNTFKSCDVIFHFLKKVTTEIADVLLVIVDGGDGVFTCVESVGIFEVLLFCGSVDEDEFSYAYFERGRRRDVIECDLITRRLVVFFDL